MHTAETLRPFLEAAQAKVTAEYVEFCRDCTPEHIEQFRPRLSLEIGKRYARIVKSEANGSSRSAFGFVDLTTGDVLKADGWKGPAKNFARGNVADALHGCGRIRWTGVH